MDRLVVVALIAIVIAGVFITYYFISNSDDEVNVVNAEQPANGGTVTLNIEHADETNEENSEGV